MKNHKKVTGGDSSPVSNTGGNSQDTQEVGILHIDTLSLTSKFDDFPRDRRVVSDGDIINKLNVDLQARLGLLMVGDHAGGKNGYKESRLLGYSDSRPHENLGFVAWGGNAGSYQLYLTGEACEYLHMNDLIPSLYKLADYCSMRIKRIDIAYDDFKGKLSVNHALKFHIDGKFTITRTPKIRQVGDWVNPDDPDGRTVYIGNRKNGKMLRVYEKGKQLGDPLNPWVRWEVELKAIDREIPLEALEKYEAFFLGAYPALSSFRPATATEVIKTVSKVAKIQFQKLVHYASSAYGKLFNVMKELHTPDEIFSLLVRDGVPRRLIMPVVGKSTKINLSDVIDQTIPRDEWGVI